MIKKFTSGIIATVLFLSSAAIAQTADQKWSLGAHLSTMDYKGDLGNNIFKFKNGLGGGIQIGRYLNPSFDLQGFINYGKVGINSDDVYNFTAKALTANLNLKYKFNNGYILKEEAFVAPYLLAGFGETYVSTTGTGKELSSYGNDVASNSFSKTKYSDLNVMMGVGVTFNISEKVNLFLQSDLYYPLNDRYDGTGRPWAAAGNDKRNDRIIMHSLGFNVNLGKVKDTDNDGVSDKKDECPTTPVDVKVDAKGCAIDTDKDGVADYLDKCPAVAGLDKFAGCPDTDGDGVTDADDTCPKVAGLSQFAGCPDTDGDGVEDSKDKCPDTKAGNKVDASGCDIDTDKDGVADYMDDCPKVKGSAESKGCPISKEDEVLLKNASASIFFETSSSIIKKSSYTELEVLSGILAKYPNLKVEVEGHTDATGNEEKNIQLSKDRAAAVKDYLVKKGFKADHISSEGYGSAKPVETNETPEGRAKNRRVEIVTSMFEVK